jgi:hypothetical protein
LTRDKTHHQRRGTFQAGGIRPHERAGRNFVFAPSVTNAVALLLNSTNQWSGTVHNVDVTNCALHLEDLVNSRPAKLDLTASRSTPKIFPILPGTNLTAAFSLRWNTNGTIKTERRRVVFAADV